MNTKIGPEVLVVTQDIWLFLSDLPFPNAIHTLVPKHPLCALDRTRDESRARVYRSWRNAQDGIPARILWYVSGATVYQSEGHIRAVSQLAEVQVDRPLTLYRRFARLGVYTRDDVMKASAGEGRVMALRFVDTELLEAPVSLNTIREMSERIGKPFVALPSPQRVSEQLFATIYERGSRYVT